MTNDGLRALAWTLAAVFVFQAAVSVVCQTYLFDDGGPYVYWLMSDQRPMTWDAGRRLGMLITQFPVVVGIHAGVRNVGVISRLLGFGLYLPPVVGTITCLWIARDRVEYMIFPLLSVFSVTSSTDFFIISEGNALTALFWPLVFLFTLEEKWSRQAWLGAVLFAFPTLRCYESMILLGPILAGLAAWRAWKAHRAGDKAARNGFLVFALYFTAGIAVGARWTIHPRQVENLENFTEAIRFYTDGAGNWHLLGLLSVAGVGLVSALFLVGDWNSRFARLMLTAFAIASVIGALSPWIWPHSVVPMLHARARTLNAFVPPLLALVLLYTMKYPVSRQRLRYAYTAVALLAAAQFAWHVQASRQWTNYLDVFRNEVATHEGLVPFDSTSLILPEVNGHPIANLNGDVWEMPVLSILLSPGGRVQAMIAVPHYKGFQPFDPAHPVLLKDLSRYGITYDSYRAALARQSP